MNGASYQPDPELVKAREQLLRSIAERGIAGPQVLAAIAEVPREAFVALELQRYAYDDNALPTAYGQTISQPTVVAMMTTALHLTGNEHVLEIGTGSGYQAAILSRLAKDCVSIELHAGLAEHARDVLRRIGVTNVRVVTGDGSLGVPEHAPYDRIIVTAAAPEVPDALLQQLRPVPGSMLVAPVGDQQSQVLTTVEWASDGWKTSRVGSVRFVPLRGEGGWTDTQWRTD